jgi:choline dehydrogenase-like flavoprotein
MHIDARHLENNSLIEGDICIIGAGAAGISIALDWINSPFKVILLEGGGFEYEQQMQDLYRGQSTGQQYYPLHGTRLHYFGGTTGHWAGMCSPFDQIDFKKRDWVPDSGWPITREDLDPYYARAHEKLKLGPYRYEMDYWQHEFPNMNALPFDSNVIWHKMWQFSQARFNPLYKDTIVGAKNIHLYTYANVVNIEANENVSSITEVIVTNNAGKTHTVRAKHFIMACGAIQNARMLLASNSQAKAGLGNDNDLVGRYFMEHIEIASGELWLLQPFPTDLYTWTGNPRAELAITAKVQEEQKILNGTADLTPLSIAKNLIPRMELMQEDDYDKAIGKFFSNWDEAAKKAETENSGSISRAYQFQTRLEQAPNPNSRITIGPDKDEFGVPKTVLHWELTELDKRSIRMINKLIGYQAGKAGFGRVRLKEFLRDENDNSWPEGTNAGWHHMGTTRMADDPKKGVVNANCQVHGIENLFVAGSACYATSGAPNPTLTLVALSLRLSDHVKGKLTANIA